MDVFLIGYIFLVEMVDVNLFLAVGGAEEFEEIALEGGAV